ncbi:MAG: GNAT family N-acetyltransferase [Cyclobacteriaceae bacterium]|nr:GNAT family N-acetyltransferase [Cyclobacteriaceae bacterium]
MLIRIRPWKEGDEMNLVKYANNKNIARNLRELFPNPYTLSDARTWIAFNKDLLPALNMAIIWENEVIGAVGIVLKEDIHRKNAEIGYWIGEPFWRKGFATKAVKMMIDYTFENYDVTRIFASTFDHNIASQKVLLKSGFKLEARLKKALFKNGRYADEIIMSLLKEDYLT